MPTYTSKGRRPFAENLPYYMRDLAQALSERRRQKEFALEDSIQRMVRLGVDPDDPSLKGALSELRRVSPHRAKGWEGLLQTPEYKAARREAQRASEQGEAEDVVTERLRAMQGLMEQGRPPLMSARNDLRPPVPEDPGQAMASVLRGLPLDVQRQALSEQERARMGLAPTAFDPMAHLAPEMRALFLMGQGDPRFQAGTPPGEALRFGPLEQESPQDMLKRQLSQFRAETGRMSAETGRFGAQTGRMRETRLAAKEAGKGKGVLTVAQIQKEMAADRKQQLRDAKWAKENPVAAIGDVPEEARQAAIQSVMTAPLPKEFSTNEARLLAQAEHSLLEEFPKEDRGEIRETLFTLADKMRPLNQSDIETMKVKVRALIRRRFELENQSPEAALGGAIP